MQPMTTKNDYDIVLLQGSKLKKGSGCQFVTSYENLVATLKIVFAKLIDAI